MLTTTFYLGVEAWSTCLYSVLFGFLHFQTKYASEPLICLWFRRYSDTLSINQKWPTGKGTFNVIFVHIDPFEIRDETMSGCCLGCGSISSPTSPGQALEELLAGAGGGSRPKLLVIKYLFVICYLLSRYLTFILPSTQTKRNTAQAFRRWSVSWDRSQGVRKNISLKMFDLRCVFKYLKLQVFIAWTYNPLYLLFIYLPMHSRIFFVEL